MGRVFPAGAAFHRSLGALYGVAYTLRFARKAAGKAVFKVGALEGRWTVAPGTAAGARPPPPGPPRRWRPSAATWRSTERSAADAARAASDRAPRADPGGEVTDVGNGGGVQGAIVARATGPVRYAPGPR